MYLLSIKHKMNLYLFLIKKREQKTILSMKLKHLHFHSNFLSLPREITITYSGTLSILLKIPIANLHHYLGWIFPLIFPQRRHTVCAIPPRTGPSVPLCWGWGAARLCLPHWDNVAESTCLDKDPHALRGSRNSSSFQRTQAEVPGCCHLMVHRKQYLHKL